MPRLLLCLPLCLFLNPSRTELLPARSAEPRAVADRGGKLPTDAEMEQLARTDPMDFLETCIRRYQREVQGYKAVLQKQERIDGILNEVEVIDVCFREKPYSVLMIWQKGARLGGPERSLYVEGQNDDKLLARPFGALARFAAGDVVMRDVNGPDARKSSRYTMAQAGMKNANERTLTQLSDLLKRGEVKIEYTGVQKLKEAGDRPCYAFRTTMTRPDAEGVARGAFYYDQATWLQVGSVLEREDGSVIGAYYFRAIELNPKFKDGQFDRAALTP